MATKEAVRLAKEKGATLVILRVVEQDPAMYLEQVSEDVGLRGGTGVDGVLFAQQLASESGLKTEIMEREGAVTGEILRAADEAKVSMIVMGSSNPRGLAGLYLGNVAEAVTKKAKVSVFIIKPTEEDIEAALKLAKTPLPTPEENALRSIIHSRKFRSDWDCSHLWGAVHHVHRAGHLRAGYHGHRIAGRRRAVMGMTVILLAIMARPSIIMP